MVSRMSESEKRTLGPLEKIIYDVAEEEFPKVAARCDELAEDGLCEISKGECSLERCPKVLDGEG